MRIALFDIDGTLLSMGGAAREAFTRAAAEASGRPIDSGKTSFVGRTDPQIACELLAQHGVDGAELAPAVLETIRLYLGHFERALENASGARLLPGVPSLLAALARRDDVRVALLTGNVERGARLKLGYFDLTSYFDFRISAFGSDHADRYQLPAKALERARAVIGPEVSGDQLVIIGDSEHDVLCGREIGARSVAVSTGWTDPGILRALGPDALLTDLSDTGAAIAAIAGDTA